MTLSIVQKNRILELRGEGLSQREIAEQGDVHINTVANYLREQDQEIKETQERKQREGEVHFDSSINKVRTIETDLEKILDSEELKAEDRREWEKRLGDLRGLIQTEVNDRIASERAETIERRDGDWHKFIKKNYVEATAVAALESTIKQKEDILQNLAKKNADLQSEIQKLQSRVQKLQNENLTLMEENKNIKGYVDKQLDDAGRIERSKLRLERESFAREKTEFDQHVKKEEEILGCWREELNAKQIKLDAQEKKVNALEKELDDRGRELDTLQEKIKQDLDENKQILDEIKKRSDENEKTVQTIAEGRQKMKEEGDEIWQKRQNLEMTTIELSEIRRKNL